MHAGVGNETKWYVRWRLFFITCAESFAYNNGQEWFVSHYLFENKSARNTASAAAAAAGAAAAAAH